MDKLAFNSIASYALAYAVIIFLFLLSFAKLYIIDSGSIRPNFILPIIYFWALYRPTLIPAVLIFALGLIYDLFLGFPAGLNSILYLLIYWIVKNQRLFFLGQSYVVIWIGFSIATLIYYLAQYAFFILFLLSYVEIMPQIHSLLICIIIFPLLSYIFIKINSVLPIIPTSSITVN